MEYLLVFLCGVCLTVIVGCILFVAFVIYTVSGVMR